MSGFLEIKRKAKWELTARTAFSCKNVLRYFGKVWHKSNVCIIQYYWLIAIYLSIWLVCNAGFLTVNTVVSGKKSVMSTNKCARTSCWLVRACAPHLWFVHLPNWHFSLHLPPLQRPGICVVENFQRFRFGSLQKISQIRVKQESTFMFTFTLRTIYEVNVTALYIEMCWPTTDNDAIPTLYIINTLYLTLSAFYRASNQFIRRSIITSINTSIDKSIHRSIHRLIDQ